MAEYEYNGDLWFYKGHEYRRGDVVTIGDDIDDDHKAFITQLVDTGTLVEPGHAEKLRKEQADAEEAAEERRLAQIEHDDAEAARRLDAEQRRLHGDKKVDEDQAAAEKAEQEASKPASRRASSK